MWHCSSTLRDLLRYTFEDWKCIKIKKMKDIVYDYMAFGENYWWAFLIAWLLLIIVARIPNFVDFRKLDLIIPGFLFAVWYILQILRHLRLI